MSKLGSSSGHHKAVKPVSTRGRGLGRRDLGYGSQGSAPQANSWNELGRANPDCRTPDPSVPTLSLSGIHNEAWFIYYYASIHQSDRDSRLHSTARWC